MDVLGVREDGYHEVATVMQQIALSDDLDFEWQEAGDTGIGGKDESSRKLNIRLSTNRPYLPNDERNLAYKAALLMEKYAEERGCPRYGDLSIRIYKRIPVAAGLAGGSGNGAAVMIALNRLWELGLNTEELCRLGAELGSDVPFMILTQNSRYTCALGTGRGEKLRPLSRELDMSFLLVKPRFGVSTGEVYKGIDEAEGLTHPDNDALIEGILEGDKDKTVRNMGNMLEAYTLKAYPEVNELKKLVSETEGVKFAMMSGSGPTVIGFYDKLGDAKKAAGKFRELGYESFYAGNMRRVRRKR